MAKYRFIFIILIILIMLFSWDTLFGQCPMCKMTAESNLKDGGTAGKGLNAGILYMLLAPYILVGSLAFFWIRKRRKANTQINEGLG